MSHEGKGDSNYKLKTSENPQVSPTPTLIPAKLNIGTVAIAFVAIWAGVAETERGIGFANFFIRSAMTTLLLFSPVLFLTAVVLVLSAFWHDLRTGAGVIRLSISLALFWPYLAIFLYLSQ